MSQQPKKSSGVSGMKNYDTAKAITSAWGLTDNSRRGRVRAALVKTEEGRLDLQEFILSSYGGSHSTISDFTGDDVCFQLEDPFGLQPSKVSTKEPSNPFEYEGRPDLPMLPQLKRLKVTPAERISKSRSGGTKTNKSAAKSAAPVIPAKPETPAIPAKPETPAIPAKPETPAIPAKPETPAIPAKPVAPIEPIEVHVKLPSHSHLPVIMKFSQPIQFLVSQVQTSVNENTQVEKKELMEYEFTSDALQFTPSSLL